MKIVVHAGAHRRSYCPMRVVLPLDSCESICLQEEETGELVPCQCRSEGQQITLSWLLDALEAGASRAYHIVTAREQPTAPRVVVTDTGQEVEVAIGAERFTSYHYDRADARPFLYPVIGPFGHPITRGYPMVENVPGEKQDHPHHRSLYTAFGDVNGVDDWSEGQGHGRIVHKRFSAVESGSVYGRIVAENGWVSSTGELVVAETREMIYYATPVHARLIDYSVAFHAGQQAVTFGDTKEGGILSVRVATSMDVNSGLGGRISNAYGGIDEGETWGKPSPWCDYSGPVAGRIVGIAVLDHPENLRHPTQWHVRDYGLMTANCFGWSYYRDDRSIDGSYTMPSNADLCFRYRVYVHSGQADRVPDRFIDFAFPPRVAVEA